MAETSLHTHTRLSRAYLAIGFLVTVSRPYFALMLQRCVRRLCDVMCGETVRPRAKVTIDSQEVVYEKSSGTKMNDLDL